MKSAFSILLVVLSPMLSACAASPAQVLPPTMTEVPPAAASVTDTAQPAPTQASEAATLTPNPTPTNTTEIPVVIPYSSKTPTPQVIVVVPLTSTESASPIPDAQNPVSYTVTVNDNGKTFTLRVGDNILLNLGADMYDWNVSVDNPSVISLRMGVLAIQGSQGIFDAHAPGSATLTAVGNPKCINLTPPCMMPSMLFNVTVIVQ